MKTKQEVEENINTNPNAVKRALVVLYLEQTAEEQVSYSANTTNKKGFNGVDASFGTSLAEQCMKGRELSEKQLAAARKMLKKYVTQLTKLYNQTDKEDGSRN